MLFSVVLSLFSGNMKNPQQLPEKINVVTFISSLFVKGFVNFK
jgi:hypothetical protein